MSYFLRMSGGWLPLLVSSCSAIGLELRIRLWHIFWIGLRRSGSVCLLLFTLTLFANFASTAPMSFRWPLRKFLPPGVSFVSLPSFRRAGCLWKVSGCLCVVSREFSSPSARLGPAWEAGRVTWARSWSSGFRWRSCCSLCRSTCRARFSGRDALSVDPLSSYFSLCGRWAIVGGLRTANDFPAFALVDSVGPVAVFWPLAAPLTPLAWSIQPLSFMAAALACSPGVRCDH